MDDTGRKKCLEFIESMGITPPPILTSTGDDGSGSPDASQETPSSAAGRLMSLDIVGAPSSFAFASTVVWSVLN